MPQEIGNKRLRSHSQQGRASDYPT
jgi:hypothetical protein